MSEMHKILANLAEKLARKHYKLAIITGNEVMTAISVENCVSIDLNIHLAQALLNMPVSKRPRKVVELLGDMLGEQASPYVGLHGLEVLFEPSLQVEVVGLLKQLSHDHVMVVAWPGDFMPAARGGKLSYSELGHIEYKDYTITTEDDFEVISYQNLIRDTE